VYLKNRGVSYVIQDQVRAFVTSNFYVAQPDSLQNSDSLLDSGVIDSTGVLEIIAFIEESFGLTVEDAEILPENLDSIDRISSFVVRKMK
jgi:acyl carrier protein